MSSVTPSLSKESVLQPQPSKTPIDQQTQALPQRRPLKKAEKREKSANAFRTISEVATELKVEQHVLRFWETKFSQIKPVKRGGGRRYYRPEDFEALKKIHHFLYSEGYTIKGVQKLLSTQKGRIMTQGQETTSAISSEPLSPSLSLSKNKIELKEMLDELRSLRRMLEA